MKLVQKILSILTNLEWIVEINTTMDGMKEGKDSMALKSGTRKGRVNMIAAYRDGQLIAPFTVDGPCNRIIFESWIATCLIPYLKPGQYLILDNATFHKGGNIKTMVEETGCKIYCIYLLILLTLTG